MNEKLFPLYVINCLSGKEGKTRDFVAKLLPELPVLLPKRKMMIRRAGKSIIEQKSLFPGYFFVNTDKPLELYRTINGLEGFIRILWNNDNPTPLPREEGELIQSLISGSGSEEIDISKGFMKDGRVTVTEGPLKELAGRIIDVDKRKSRALVELSFFNRVMKVWLGLEIMEKDNKKN